MEKKRNGEIESDDPEIQEQINVDNERYFKGIETRKKLLARTALHDAIITKMRHDLSKRNGYQYTDICDYVDEFIRSENVILDKQSSDYRNICNSILAIQIRTHNIVKEHTIGNYETDYDIEIRNKKTYLTLSQLVVQYENDKSPSWVDPSRIKSTHRQILHILGDVSLDTIDISTKNKLIESLKIYPRKVSHTDMSIPWQELAKRNLNRLSDSSQHYIKTAFSTLINFAREQELGIKGNPTKGISGKKPVNPRAHIPYSAYELQQLVNALATIDRDKTPEMFWIPLILLFTGARSNEACMLRCEDIQLTDNIWTINFYNKLEHNQRTKNGKDRQAPIHQQLIDLGFIVYVSALKSISQNMLFRDIRLYRGKWNVYFGKDFNRTFKLKFLVGYDKELLAEKDLHSFRKNFISWYVQRKEFMNPTDISILQSIIGHFEQIEISTLLQFIESNKLTTELYGGGFGQTSLQNSMLQQLDYGLDFSRLLDSDK